LANRLDDERRGLDQLFEKTTALRFCGVAIPES
jgi:hypothetical protein